MKEIRRDVARENDIPLEIPECTYEGDCRGTCPRCEAEVRYLEKELGKRKSLGKAVTIAGIALSSMVAAGCSSPQTPGEAPLPQIPPVEETAVVKTDTIANDTIPKEEEKEEVYYNGGIEWIPGYYIDSTDIDGEIIEEVGPDTSALKNTIEVIDEPADE
ncbi:MAG: hypothetical protein J6S87_00145, partial [Bacteroidales bacterium]|nr:hypothetical protein [Bacteroidales bacterium]